MVTKALAIKKTELAFKKKDWGKTYTLYEKGICSIKCTMESFNFSEQKATFNIEVVYPREKYDSIWACKDTVNYHLKNFTIDEFKRVMHKSILRIIDNAIKMRTKYYAEELYRDAKYWKYQLEDKDLRTGSFSETYEKLSAIKDEELRERLLEELRYAYLDYLNIPYNELINNYCKTHRLSFPDLDDLYKELSTMPEAKND
jgi:hypothetical protein